MSWQTYIDDHLMVELQGGGKLEHAAIVGRDGGVWAQSANFPEISTAEVEALVKGLSDPSQLAQNGVKLGGEKYILIPGEAGEVIRGKKGAGGVTIARTEGALVIGIYGEGLTHSQCNVAVEEMADYLKGQGI